MGQLTVHRNPNPQTSRIYPYLLDIQSDVVTRLPTRVVVPLARSTTLPYARLTHVMPEVQVLGELCVLVTPELAGVAKSSLGQPVADLADQRAVVIAALDFLFTGA